MIHRRPNKKPPRPRRRWRAFRTSTGSEPTTEFLESLDAEDRAVILAGMQSVRRGGLRVSRHLRGEIYEVRVRGRDLAYRLLFASEGKQGQVLLSLHAFAKKTQKTPPAAIELAETRLMDWRSRRRRD
jgi:phage-related protein